MPRQPRLILPGVAAHIVQRGNNRSACFASDSDYQVYLLHLRELSEKMKCAVHAYCLMTNHVHLLLTPESPEGCAVLMRELGQRYVQYFNRRHGRTGTLWEGRFRSCVAESSRYVLTCHRYIELNPVRAGMVANPSEYSWSSFRGNAGSRKDTLIAQHPEYEALGSDESARQAAYRGLFDTAVDLAMLNAIRDATNGGLPLGSEAFKLEISAATGRHTDRRHPGRPSKSTLPAG